ncbi:DEKNAAC105592 [Brettanomyces naardenensis]|uniref:Vacuolar protein sorting-associated protein n=1 Tax=Brettanomyces naardenensis TaxID=13370 RepID=A0A448YU63_BRENA|nr:DEKNAAC105592 [Brettanomyces naardenensis]
MLESLVATVLNRTLGAYVENFDPAQLNIGIWSGDVKLRDLKLKEESLDRLGLPIALKFGHLGELTLQIPWSNLKSKPVKIIIEDVYVLARARLPTEFDLFDEEAREQRAKQDKLNNLELLESASPETDSDEEQARNQSFMESLTTKVVDNLQVTIRNIHFRYEDDDAFTSVPYSVGITLKELSAVSTDDNWLPGFIMGANSLACKLMTLKALSVYWDTNSSSIYDPNENKLLKSFQDIINKISSSSGEVQHLLLPVSGYGHLTINKKGSTESAPHYALELFFEEFGLALDANQYKDILWTASQVTWYKKTYKFRRLRPKLSVEEDPEQWLRYAFRCVYDEIHDRNYKWTWEYFKKRRDQRKSYIELWKAHLSNTETLQLKTSRDELEAELDFEDIKFYRELAKLEYKKQHHALPSSKPAPQQQSGYSFFSWWSGQQTQDTGAATSVDDEKDLSLDDEQRKELYDAIEFDESKTLADSLEIPRERVKLSIGCNLQRGSFSIKKSEAVKPSAGIFFGGMHADLFQRKDSYYVGFKLREFRVEDGSADTLYKHIVSVKPFNGKDAEDDANENSEIENPEQEEPFFQISFEQNPLDDSADSELLAKMNSMTIFHNPKFVQEVVHFFRSPKTHVDTIGALMNAAETTIHDFTQQTRMGLEYAFEEHKTLNCKMDLQAPLIIMPMDCGSWSSPVCVLDAGHISIVSDLADKDMIKKFNSDKRSSYTESDWEEMTTFLYDKFNLRLQDAQMLIGPSIKSTIEQLHAHGEKPSLILDHLTINILLELSIVPSYYRLPLVKISGDIPRIKAVLNDYQHRIFMEALMTMIPEFDDESSSLPVDSYRQMVADDVDRIPYDGSLELDDSEPSIRSQSDSLSASVQELIDKQHRMEVSLKIGVIILTASRCSNPETFEADKLADVVGENFRLQYYSTAREMHVNVVLADLSVDDYMETTGNEEFKKLVSSRVSSDEGAHEDLFHVGYVRTQRMARFKGELIEAFDQNIDLNISDFKLVLTRKSVLTLINFLRNTFVDPDAPLLPADKLRHNDEADVENAPEHIDMNVSMKSITLVFNDDGYKIATLKLQKAVVGMLLLPDKMKIDANLGGISLRDDINESIPALKQLVRIQGDELAKFHYETFDPATNTLPYSSELKFETGSVVVTFVESAFARLYSFLSQFNRMRYIYDSAREAALNQANSIENPDKMKFDILVRAPIFVFPEVINPATGIIDEVKVNLGEIDTSNEFVIKGGEEFNIIAAKLKSTKISSRFTLTGAAQTQNLEIIEKLDVIVHVDYYDGTTLDRPSTIITGSIDGNEMKLTEWQANFIMQILQSIPRAFSDYSISEESIEDLENDATNANMIISKDRSPERNSGETGPKEEVSTASGEKIDADGVSVNVTFKIPILALTLFNDTKHSVSLERKSLTRVTLNDLGVKYKLMNSNDYEMDVHIKSLTVSDLRENRKNKFTDIIPGSPNVDYQFMASMKSSGPVDQRLVDIDLAIDSPKLILAMDYLVALNSFADVAMKAPTPTEGLVSGLVTINEESEAEAPSPADKRIADDRGSPEAQSTVSYAVSIVDPSIILLAYPERIDSEAIVFKISQIMASSHEVTSVKLKGIGMFLCKMDTYETSRLRIIDDFSVDFNMDTRGSTATSFLTTINADVEPLLMRVSLRDVNLAIEIFNKATRMYGDIPNEVRQENAGPRSRHASISSKIGRTISKYAPSVLSSFSHVSKKAVSAKKAVVLVKAEKLKASFGGVRLVLIGDVHELPVLDMEVKPLEVTAKNWSTDLQADTAIKPSINIYNYSTSAWEPLLDPWSFGVHVERVCDPRPHLSVSVSSRESAEFSVTSRSIATLSYFASLISDNSEIKQRGKDAPYLIINQTGYDLNIWIDEKSADVDHRRNMTLLKNESEIPWAFEDWRQIRENLSMKSESNYIGIDFVDSGYSPVRKVSLTREGEEVFMLEPTCSEHYHNRLACQIVLAPDKVKHVILKSTVTFHNHTPTGILVGVGNYNNEFVVDREIHIPANGKLALPIDYVYNGKLSVRPETVTEQFGWSVAMSAATGKTVSFDWKSIMKNDLVLQCGQMEEGSARSVFFRAKARFDPDEALSRIYPHLTVNITPPMIIENLLPFDIKWQLFQKGSPKWSDQLRHAESCSVQVVNMNYSAVLKITALGSKYRESSAAIINSRGDDSTVDKRITLRSEDGQTLHLGLFYTNNEEAGCKITIYTPYLIVNRTGKNVCVSDGYNTLISDSRHLILDGEHKAIPDMFSFEHEASKGFLHSSLEENLISIKVGDSMPSSGFSIDTVGQTFEVKVPLRGKTLEHDIGLHITEGQGIFNLTKVVTLAPRFIVNNNIECPIFVRSVGTSEMVQLTAGSVCPIYGVPKSEPKQLVVGFGDKASWSAPFNINNVGEIYVRVKRLESTAHRLLRVVISTENASIFISVLDAKDLWPYSIRNFSDFEFLVYQSDPSMSADGTRSSRLPFKPIFYRVPPKSLMPYAWDYPAAEVKELVLRCGNRERFVQLAEMGTLYPMKLPASVDPSHEGAKIVDLNVVADGPVQSLVISNYDPKTSLYQLKSTGSSQTVGSNTGLPTEEFETNIKDENYYTSIVFNFEGMGLSLINFECQEICYITVRGAELRYNESDIYQNVSLKLKWIQADNQLFPAVFPILLYPSVVPKSRKEMDKHPAFSVGVSRVKDNAHGVRYIKLATMLLQEMSIEIDEDMLSALLEYSRLPGASWNSIPVDNLWDENIEIPEPPEVRTRDDFYFELLHMQPLQFNFSFVRTESAGDNEAAESGNPITLAVNALTMAIGNVNDAPIRLSALILENVRTPMPYLRQNIEEHYKQAFLYQWYKVLGSADVIGNPVGLFNNISSGVMDIFYEPYQGYIMSDRPQELGIGLAKGGLSFLKKSVFGVSDSFSRFTNSLAKGLTAASMDKNFQEKRRQNRMKNKPNHPFAGFATGTSSLFEGITSGFAGVAAAPIEGASKEGAAGFFKGLGRGLIGLPTKTATGVLDFANDISEGIKKTTTAFDTEGLDRVRLPRNISYDGCVTSYSEREAQGQYWLKTCEGGKFSSEKYLAHVMLHGNEHACIFSLSRIMIVTVAILTVDWDLPYEQVGNITLENTGIRIKQSRVGFPERFISIPDRSDQKFLYHSIAIAVGEYNKRCIVSL